MGVRPAGVPGPRGDLGDGTVFNPMAGPDFPPSAILSRDPARVRADYRDSIEYSLTSLISYVHTYGDDHLALVRLGDHQPAPNSPVWPMDDFRDRFMTAFGSTGGR